MFSVAYLMLVGSLKGLTWFAWKRANRSVAKWAGLEQEAEAVEQQRAALKSSKPAELAAAYARLGMVVIARDRQQARADRKNARAAKLERATAAVAGWKGKGVPYSAGVIDATLGLALGQIFQPWVVERLVPLVTAWAERLRELVG